DRADVVGRQLGSGPRPAIEAALAKDRVELLLAKTITALGPTRVAFADGALNTDAVVLATGMVAAPFAAKVPGLHDEQGRIVVDQSLRAGSAREIFVAGDAPAAGSRRRSSSAGVSAGASARPCRLRQCGARSASAASGRLPAGPRPPVPR